MNLFLCGSVNAVGGDFNIVSTEINQSNNQDSTSNVDWGCTVEYTGDNCQYWDFLTDCPFVYLGYSNENVNIRNGGYDDIINTTQISTSKFVFSYPGTSIMNGETWTLSGHVNIDPKDLSKNGYMCIVLDTEGGIDVVSKPVNAPFNDLGVSLDYRKTVNNLPTYHADNIYGADNFQVILKATNYGSNADNVKINFKLPSAFKYLSSTPSGAYDDVNGIWTINSIASGQTTNLYLNVLAVKSGRYNLAANISYPGDTDTSNNSDSKTINIHNLVILVHGFTGSPSDWDTVRSYLNKEGIKSYAFNYSPGTQDPYSVSVKLNTWIRSYIQGTKLYKGKINVVCHSMGALVSRFYMQRYGSSLVDQWIGLAPVNKGAAIADLIINPNLSPTIYNKMKPVLAIIGLKVPYTSSAVYNMVTTDPQTKELNDQGPAPGVTYRVLVGVGRLVIGVDTVVKINNKYYFTTNGDGIVANLDSALSWQKSYNRYKANHLSILKNTDTINKLIYYLKNG